MRLLATLIAWQTVRQAHCKQHQVQNIFPNGMERFSSVRRGPSLLQIPDSVHIAQPNDQTMEVKPGELQSCINSGASRCHLLPGIHREHIDTANSSRQDTVEITGAPGSLLSGAEPVPGPWSRWKGDIYKAVLPASLRGKDIQQVWAGSTWLPEARWPNANLTHGGPATAHGGPLSLSSWAKTYGRRGQTDNCTECTRLRQGVIVDGALAASGIDFNGALATLNVGFRFFTWTRRVNHSAGSDRFFYDPSTPKGQKGLVGGSGSYLDKGEDNLYFLSGVLAALDSPGEYFIDRNTGTIYVWMPDSTEPAGVRVKVRDYCLQGRLNLTNLTFWGCTFYLRGNALHVKNVSLMYPSFHKTIDPRDVDPGPIPPQTILQGDGGVVEHLWMRYAQNGGLKVVGNNNHLSEILMEDMTWLGSLDFPPIELGFAFANPTQSRMFRGELGDVQHETNTGHADVEDHMHTVWGGVNLGGVDPTYGNDNSLTRTTLRRFGEMGVVTSQRSNTLSYLHVHDGGLIGLDNACVHADNTYVDCMNYSLAPEQRSNCSKTWHHMWIHDCREKGVRGDDFNLNLTLHHLVVYNLGEGRDGYDRNDSPVENPEGVGAATGAILKGDYNRVWQSTFFNTSIWGQGDLCATSLPLGPAPGRSFPRLQQQNQHSVFLNTVAKTITGQRGPVFPNASFTKWVSMVQLNAKEMKLRDPEHFDFRPTPSSPLVGAGSALVPFAPLKPDGTMPDVGAYQADDNAPWEPGCSFTAMCKFEMSMRSDS